VKLSGTWSIKYDERGDTNKLMFISTNVLVLAFISDPDSLPTSYFELRKPIINHK